MHAVLKKLCPCTLAHVHIDHVQSLFKSLFKQVSRNLTGSETPDSLWEVLMLVDSEAAAQVSGAAETVDYFR